jgi:hypothetical protein
MWLTSEVLRRTKRKKQSNYEQEHETDFGLPYRYLIEQNVVVDIHISTLKTMQGTKLTKPTVTLAI